MSQDIINWGEIDREYLELWDWILRECDGDWEKEYRGRSSRKAEEYQTKQGRFAEIRKQIDSHPQDYYFCWMKTKRDTWCRGIPWPEFMAERFKYFAPMEAVEELRRIAMNSKRFDEILDRLPETPETKTIRRFAKTPDESVHIRIGQYDIFEEPAGWMRKTDRQTSLCLVSDVRCYIDQLLLDRRGVKKLYRGRIVYDNRTFPFRVTVERFEKDAIGFLQAVLRKRNLPMTRSAKRSSPSCEATLSSS